MFKMTCWCGVVMLAVAGVTAKDFPLQFKVIKGKEVSAFPGGYGAYAEFQLVKPEQLKKEPKALSKHPLYGAVRLETSDSNDNRDVYCFRLDESKGDGKGYDLLIVDMNQNGDLTDEAVVKPASSFFDVRPKQRSGEEQGVFGPIEAPANKKIGNNRLLYYADVYVNRPDFSRLKQEDRVYLGMMRFKVGWYLEATVDLPGVKQKIGLFDANGDGRLGEAWQAQTYNSGEEKSWYFQPRDSFLVDMDKSGAFEENPIYSESCSFGPILYLGTKPYKVKVASDYKSVQVEPWTEGLVEVSLQPNGSQVRIATLAWESAKGEWKLIRPGVQKGKIQVPAGNYRLYSSLLAAKALMRDQVLASGFKRTIGKTMAFGPGKENVLACGGPLEVKVSTQKQQSPQSIGYRDAKGNWLSKTVSQTNFLAVSAMFTGAGGEVYSGFGKGKDFELNPPKPTFTIVDAKGKLLQSGNLEFG